ncbi:glycosyltransferase family 4 protein [Methylocystis parvus]|nr:glycosyltransferase family 1 protein [Methylocystis parvus]WBK00331.1 glycosyltransferase family 4 protein [Methylocystis parvus OBBP]
MLLERTEELEIAAYLNALTRLERADEAGASHARRQLTRLQKLIRLRAMELYWTVSRFLRQSEAFLFPGYVERRNRVPAWKKIDQPTLAPEAALAARPRLLLDMTSTLRSGKNTGIQRVVREIARNGWLIGAGLPVAIHNGRLFTYYSHPDIPEIVEIEQGDIFLMLDASWNHTEEYLPILDRVKAKGGKNIVCLYDILPLIHPAAFPPALTQRFVGWLSQIVLKSDGVVADSRAAAESLRDYLSANNLTKPGVPLGWWRLGADFSGAASGDVSERAQEIVKGRPYFLGVGTVEPRKGYPVALDALEKLWDAGVDASYVVVGGKGWGMRQFERRLKHHPEFGKRLFWLDRASDADLAFLYRNARALALASVAEGFGLPIVEAANYGAPVIATDIAVFREVAGDSARYFDLLDSDSLAERMREALAEKPAAPVVAPTSWRESATQLLGIARDGGFQTRLD